MAGSVRKQHSHRGPRHRRDCPLFVNPEATPISPSPSSSAVMRRQMWASARRPRAAPCRPPGCSHGAVVPAKATEVWSTPRDCCCFDQGGCARRSRRTPGSRACDSPGNVLRARASRTPIGPAARAGLADSETTSQLRRAAGVSPAADAVDAARVQPADRSVAGRVLDRGRLPDSVTKRSRAQVKPQDKALTR